jgi:hypothetical protein
MTQAAAGTRQDPTGTPRPRSGAGTEDFLFDTFYGGAIGGSILALFFLAVDALRGQALFTPSLLGTALFTDATASASAEIRLDLVAYFSVVHLAAFLFIGAGLTAAYRRLGVYSKRPTLMVALTFAVLTGGFAVAGLTVTPGVVSVIGLPWIAVGNLLTAMGMVAFMEWSHRDQE